MKIYIVGISGMLGSKLFENFLSLKNVKVRGSSRKLPQKYLNLKNKIDLNVDVNNLNLISKIINKFKPNVVINCVGVVKQKIKSKNEENKVFYLNSVFPHELYKITSLNKSRLIHFSTDCVFNGKKGNYKETDKVNAKDLYGISKIYGELHLPNSLTLRTSIIGHEINEKKGLLEWFLSKKKTCDGYDKSFFSGFPTDEIFRILKKIIKEKKLCGVYHLSSSRISKYKLLKTIAKIYKKKISIKINNKYKIDRSLNSKKLKNIIDYKSPSWEKLIKKMHKNNGNNKLFC